MKFVRLAIALACLNSCGEAPNGNGAGSTTVADDERQLRYLKEVEWPKAYGEQDTLLLDRILRDEFQMIDAEGNVFTKADELDWITQNEWAVDSFRYEIKRLET